jgi:arsenite methyltransferase
MTMSLRHSINFKGHISANATRYTPKEIQEWCKEASLFIEREVVENAEITIIAKKLK